MFYWCCSNVLKRTPMARSHVTLCYLSRCLLWVLLYGLLYSNDSERWRIGITFSYTSAISWKWLVTSPQSNKLISILKFYPPSFPPFPPWLSATSQGYLLLEQRRE